jgi:hypothetical protein
MKGRKVVREGLVILHSHMTRQPPTMEHGMKDHSLVSEGARYSDTDIIYTDSDMFEVSEKYLMSGPLPGGNAWYLFY